MSYREIRNFIEAMKALGYPRSISVESFRTPNFEMTADALYFLVRRYDPGAELSDDISTEDARIDFLKSAATIMAAKARVKLNIKQLYRADGYAVKELLKISALLYDAVQAQSTDGTGSGDSKSAAGELTGKELSSKLEELKAGRGLASDILESGGKLFALLGAEDELRVTRDRALKFVDSLSLNLESNDPHELIERNIRQQITILTDNIADVEKQMDDYKRDEKSLHSKIEKKKADLERAEKRLKGVKKLKPAYMEEYETMEKELKAVYETYLERFRNVSYLESELGKYNTAEMEKKTDSDRALKRMQKRLRADELAILRGEHDVDEGAIDDTVYDSGKEDNGGGSGSGGGDGIDRDGDGDDGGDGGDDGDGGGAGLGDTGHSGAGDGMGDDDDDDDDLKAAVGSGKGAAGAQAAAAAAARAAAADAKGGRPGAAGAGAKRPADNKAAGNKPEPKVVGSMTGGDDSDEDDGAGVGGGGDAGPSSGGGRPGAAGAGGGTVGRAGGGGGGGGGGDDFGGDGDPGDDEDDGGSGDF